jgi:hypothetical protein
MTVAVPTQVPAGGRHDHLLDHGQDRRTRLVAAAKTDGIMEM